MPQPVRLRIASHRHPTDHQLGCQSQQFETHLGVTCAVQFGVLGGQIWPVSGRSHGLRLVSRRTRHNVRTSRLESACADHD